jgi:D-threo-aldose 1-dehydrogenase
MSGATDVLARLGGPAGFGFGGAPLGNLFRVVEDAAAAQTLAAAWDAGVRYYDTAPHYGAGLSEHRIGLALRDRPRHEFVLSSKVGRLLTPDRSAPRDAHGYVQTLPFSARCDYSGDGALRSIEDSLQRLGLSHIDIVYIHDVDRHTHGAAQPQRFREAMEGAWPALARLRSAGVIGAIGLGVNEAQVCVDALAHTDVDCFMVAGRYTLLDQSALDALVPACAARGVKLVLAGAYNSGVLATGAVAGAAYDYAPASTAVLERVRRIETVCASFGVPLRAAALQYTRRCPVAAGIVVGARSAAEVADAAAMLKHPIAAAFWQALTDDGLLPREMPVQG